MLALNRLTFAWPAAESELFRGITCSFTEQWTGGVGENGAGKTTLLKLCCGLLEAPPGGVTRHGEAAYCPQRTDDPPENLAAFYDAFDAPARELRQILRLDDAMPGRWPVLSHGERKRFQIACALWTAPGILALDEPTNHIDADARTLLIAALKKFNGIGLLVSHDRELLDTLCGQCLFINPPDAVMRPGGVTQGYREDQREQTAARDADLHASHAISRLKNESQRRREKGDQFAAEARKKSKQLGNKDHDERAMMNLARLTGKDAFSGKLVKQLGKQIERATASRREITVRKTHGLGITVEHTAPSQRAFLFNIPATSLPLRPGCELTLPDLRMEPTDRVALTGANGAGKSTLLRHILPRLNIEPEHLIYIPQEITAEEARDCLRRVRELPNAERGLLMTTVSQLGSRPGRLLESEQPSPGETRKIMLALGILRRPQLIIMDEPTNHMDLPSIQCLEAALGECRCGLLLVSHDRPFLEKLTTLSWRVTLDASGNARMATASSR
ncbi:MAG: ATP-binding cassette domain-containing protein [Kiritimatiellaeota bacterium]|nr:ATP-binding cassette domain-containing protein [Kiritimatiellota bacterium]